MLTNATKAKKMREAFAELTGEYMREDRHADAQAVMVAARTLACNEGSLARLFDIIERSCPSRES